MVWLVLLPLLGAAAALLLGRRAHWVLPPLAAFCLALVALLAVAVWNGGPASYPLGGWMPPLGITLRADGVSVAFLAVTAVIAAAAGAYAAAVPALRSPATGETRAGLLFWPILALLWTALNALYLGNDLFNLYVALEMITLTGVALVALEGRAENLAAALRYLVVALLGSLGYLAAAALLYGAYGTLDMGGLAALARPDLPTIAACALITAGLMAKAALFPLHVWLPPAHAGAPAAGSALLSGLVVTAPYYLAMRVWFDVLPAVPGPLAVQLVGALGAAAVATGSLLALRQERLKLLVAYSTVAQIGYLFLMFPLAGAGLERQPWAVGAWSGGILLALSHALAKAAMFLAVGTLALRAGHDRLEAMHGMARRMPVVVFTFALCGLTLLGLPPSGGFVAKWLLLRAALGSGQWWWAAVLLGGGLLTAAYLFRPLSLALARPRRQDREASAAPLPAALLLVPLALALLSVLLGLASMPPYLLLGIGRPELVGEGA